MTSKTCTKCGENKALDDFHKRKDSCDGFAHECKRCNSNRNRKWYENNQELAISRAKELRLKNPEIDRERSRKWAARNRERAKLRARSWAKNNPDRRAMHHQSRRTRKRGNGVFKILEKEIRRLRHSPCAACGTKSNVCLDHIIPINRGGRHSIGNLQSLCQPCNSSKQDKFMVEWRRQRAS